MTDYATGILLALGVACCWTGSSLAFSAAGRRVGSVPVNLIRLCVALVMLTIVGALARGRPLPVDASPYQAAWLAISGVVGFFVGDLTLFRAYVLIGPRRASLIMSLAPAFAAIVDRVALGQRLTSLQSTGILVTLAGVVWVIAERDRATPQPSPMTSPALPADAHDVHAPRANAIAHASVGGILLGLCGAAGQGVGAALTGHAYAAGRFDPFGSTQLRAAAAVPLFALFIVATRRTRDTLAALGDRRAMTWLTLGAFAGPFLGVSMFNASVARVPSGVTSTLAGLVPVVMLPVAALTRAERITPRAAVGAIVAVAGVALLALGRA